MSVKYPTQEQIKKYWAVSQGEANLPAAMFILRSDAEEWISQQQSKEIYSVVPPDYYLAS